jgi:hypothetical protein
MRKHAYLRACPAASPHQYPLRPQLCLCLQVVTPIRPQERLVSSHQHGASRTCEPTGAEMGWRTGKNTVWVSSIQLCDLCEA